MFYTVIVIGGGASGLMAAVTAGGCGARVLLIEKNNSLGKKLLLTGGGRCNVTNNCSTDEIIANIPGNGKFFYSALSEFDNLDIIDFFESRVEGRRIRKDVSDYGQSTEHFGCFYKRIEKN